jgi:hypothetical protein
MRYDHSPIKRAFCSFEFPISETLIPRHMSLLDQWSRSYHDFATSRAFVMPDQRSTISIIRRSISFRDLAYREFPHHAPLTPPMCKSAKFQSLAMCPMTPTVRIVIAISHIVSSNLFPLDFPICETPKQNLYRALIVFLLLSLHC